MRTSNASRLTTGIPGLDPILEGGLLVGGIYIVQGPPGSGKTILANQLCCHQARAGRRAIYFTLLSESHSGMLEHLRRMQFFCGELAGDAIVYFSGFKVLEDEGLLGLARLIGKTMTDRNPSAVVVDGFMTAREAAREPNDLKQFVRHLQTYSASLSCTTLLLSSTSAGAGLAPEHTIADGIIELSNDLNGLRSLRHLQVLKMRGTCQIDGRHTVEIDDKGMTVHARFEVGSWRSYVGTPVGRERRSFGVAELDAMMMGGLPDGSITMLVGASGVGKTLLSLQFLAAGAKAGETGLYFGMYERPEELLAKCQRTHLGLQEGVDAGRIHLSWHRPIEGVLDVLADRMLTQLRETGATRLCIDGMHSLFRTVDFPERMRAVSAALAEELTGRGVTTVYTLETSNLLEGSGHEIRLPIDDISAMSHNIITIRQIERRGQFDRMLAILKMRDSDYDRSIRELTITDRGIVLAPRGRLPRRRATSRVRTVAARNRRR
jgi:circadian clock protein KaiC